MRSSKLAGPPSPYHLDLGAYVPPKKNVVSQVCEVLQRVFRYSVLPGVSRRRHDSDILRWVPWPVERGEELIYP